MKNLLKLWLGGLRVALQFILLTGTLYAFALPVTFVSLIKANEILGSLLSAIYLVVVIPVCLPKMIEIVGLSSGPIPMFDFSGGMNEEARMKQQELDGQNKAEQVGDGDAEEAV